MGHQNNRKKNKNFRACLFDWKAAVVGKAIQCINIISFKIMLLKNLISSKVDHKKSNGFISHTSSIYFKL